MSTPGAEEIVISMGTPGEWGIAIALFIFVLGHWARLPGVRGSGANRDLFMATQAGVANAGWGVFSAATWLLSGVFVLLSVLLYVAWLIYLIQGTAAAPNEWYYVAVNASTAFAVLFFVLANHLFTEQLEYGWSIAFYLLSLVGFLAATGFAIAELVAISGTTDESGSNIFLLIAVGLLALGILFSIARAWVWSGVVIVGGAEATPFLGSGSRAAHAINKGK